MSLHSHPYVPLLTKWDSTPPRGQSHGEPRPAGTPAVPRRSMLGGARKHASRVWSPIHLCHVRAVTPGKAQTLFHYRKGQRSTVLRLKWPTCEKAPVPGVTPAEYWTSRAPFLLGSGGLFLCPWECSPSMCPHLLSSNTFSSSKRQEPWPCPSPRSATNRCSVSKTE